MTQAYRSSNHHPISNLNLTMGRGVLHGNAMASAMGQPVGLAMAHTLANRDVPMGSSMDCAMGRSMADVRRLFHE